MIITRTPLRVSFVGGGTDLPGYADKNGGNVISTTIDKYVYVTLNEKFDGKVSLRYSETECVDNIDDLQHDIVRECLKMYSVENGVEIVTISDVPMKGTGLGSSSALTVGLITALDEFCGRRAIDKATVALKAFEVEVALCGAPIGYQDQYASAIGGLNMFWFRGDGNNWSPVYDTAMPRKVMCFEESTMLFYLNNERSASDILKDQTMAIGNNVCIYDRLKAGVVEMWDWFRNDEPLERLGDIINEEWHCKRQLSDMISNDRIDNLLIDALDAGACGGKICGAGGGGFLLLIVPVENQDDVREAMETLHEMPFSFSHTGSEVIFAD
jgi:D-glycero-alpha-D-manno-heptose-7-phosphate kinase